jgi:shikimate dehydrogenase
VTRRVALIGRPLRRRHSQAMHDAAFAAHGIDARYELRELAEDEVEGFFRDVAGDHAWLGFQVTSPYKRIAMSHVDVVEPEAERIGAINSGLREEDGRLVGVNTHAPGFRLAVEQELDVDLAGSHVVLYGAGGAAHAVAHACVDAGVRRLTIANRTLPAAESLAARMGGTAEALGLGDGKLQPALGEADLVVNATTVGMAEPGTVVDVDALSSGARVYDLVYAPTETALILAARARGLPAANGAGMLVNQAAVAFRRWTGVEDASAAMWDALTPLLGEEGTA